MQLREQKNANTWATWICDVEAASQAHEGKSQQRFGILTAQQYKEALGNGQNNASQRSEHLKLQLQEIKALLKHVTACAYVPEDFP